jgi:Cys-tRNA(Pro) deacylase
MSVTTALRELRKHGVRFVAHEYRHEEHGGTRTAAAQLGVDEHAIVKTLVMEDEARKPVIVLMHGDREVSTRELARQIGAREVVPASASKVESHTGYVPGGVSPFGTRKKLPVYVEESVLALDGVHVNGGKRGFLVRISPADLVRVLSPVAVRVAIPRREQGS